MADTAGTTQTQDGEALLSPEFAQQLDRLDVISRKVLAGKMHGERRSKRKGRSVEFADYRNYSVGDDLRFVDWNLYARLDRLFLRLFMAEEDLSLTLLLDTSASMGFGQPNKLLFAKRICAALGYLALAHHNRVSVLAFNDSIHSQLPNIRGRQPIPRLIQFIDSQKPANANTVNANPGDLTRVLKQTNLATRGKTIIVVISDFLDKGNLSDAFRYLVGDRFDAYALQVLSSGEIDPAKANLMGDLRLIDAEDGERAEVSITPALIKRYQQNFETFQGQLRHDCLRRGVTFLPTTTDESIETIILQYLRKRGLLGP